MTTIFERVSDALATLVPAVPFALSPYKGATLPDLYIVYQLVDSPPEQHADDAETQRSNKVQVTVWKISGIESLPGIDAVMIAAGFYKSNVRQMPQDRESGHYGLATDYVYLE